MTKKTSLSLMKTGWFYLLLLSLGTVLWMIWQNWFAPLEQLNREWLYQLLPQSNVESKIVSVQIDQNSTDISPVIDKLRLKFPTTDLVYLPSKSVNINHISKKLQDAFNRRQTESENLATGLVIIASTDEFNAAQLIEPSLPFEWFDSYWRNIPQFEKVTVSKSESLVVAPLATQANKVNLLFKNAEQLLPSAMFWTLAAYSDLSRLTLHKQLDLKADLLSQSYHLGYQASVMAGGESLKSVSLAALMATNFVDAPRLIVLAQGKASSYHQFEKALARLEQKNHLTSNFLVASFATILFMFSLYFCWKISGLGWLMQTISVISFVLILGLCQYLSFTQFQWLSVFPILIVMVPWIIFSNAFRYEASIFQKIKRDNAHLVGQSASYFYSAREFEKLKPWLEKIESNKALNEKLFDLALQAESEQNTTIAFYLLEWIVSTKLGHQGAQKKLSEYRQKKNESNNSELDSTLVIAPGQTASGSFSNPALQIENFGRYQVEGVLGKGAMGIVFQGVDPKINRHVAIKTLQLSSPDFDENFAETKSRFFREAETAGNLSHANIVTIYDVGEEGELGYIAMDLLTGAPLSNFIKSGQLLPIPVVYQLMIQITDALDYAHKQNVVHRDIKPANIIYDDEIQRVTLTDFGIACMTDQSKTKTGTIMGSPFYMSPEQVLGKRVDGRSDIFSLGVTFYQLLCGHLPFNGESIASVAFHITNTKHESVRNWNSKLPASAVRITNKALQKDENKRYATMFEFKQALISALKRDFKKAPII